MNPLHPAAMALGVTLAERYRIDGLLGRAFNEYAAACETQYPRAARAEVELLMELMAVVDSTQKPAERAELVLRWLGRTVGSDSGFLYLVQSTGPTLVAQLSGAQPACELACMASQYLCEAVERAEHTQTLSTGDVQERNPIWTGYEGKRYAPILLDHPNDDGVFVSGVALLSLGTSTQLSVPTRLMHILSKALHDAGDVATPCESHTASAQPDTVFAKHVSPSGRR